MGFWSGVIAAFLVLGAFIVGFCVGAFCGMEAEREKKK